MKLPIISISLLLLCSTAWACDSYDSCMKEGDGNSTVLWDDKSAFYIKAIAYKLDEISQKLERSNQNDKNTGILL